MASSWRSIGVGALILASSLNVQAASGSDFDFWLGEWALTWADGGAGTNRITRILDGKVIHEYFNGGNSSPLRGISVSVYEEKFDRWSQTWVDNQGGYLDFHGGPVGNRIILSRRFRLDNKEIQQRMVWFDIQADSFTWNWERSEDDGQSWNVAWQIQYQRIAPD